MTELTFGNAGGLEPSQPPIPPSQKTRLLKWLRRTTAVAIWLYLVVKVFIFDLDVFLINHYFPHLSWVIDYKLFLLIGAVGICAAFFKKWSVALFIAYIIFYPLILIGWLLPYVIFKSKSWIIGFAIVNGVIHFFVKFKRNAILAAVFFLSMLAIIIADSYTILIGASITMLSFLAAVCAFRVMDVFQSDSGFLIYKKVFSSVHSHISKTYAIGEEIASLPAAQLSETQITKRTTNLEIIIIANRVCLFVASKMRDYQQSRISLIGEVFSIFFLIFGIVLAFSLITLALFKIDSTEFNVSGHITSFTFFYYSFNTFVFSSISELVPIRMCSEALSIVEKALALFVGLILVSTLLSPKNQRQSEQLSKAISDIEFEGSRMESFIQSEFRLQNMDEAIAELERLKGGFLSLVLWLSNSLRK